MKNEFPDSRLADYKMTDLWIIGLRKICYCNIAFRIFAFKKTCFKASYMKIVCLFLCQWLIISGTTLAQMQGHPSSSDQRLNWRGDIDGFLDEQARLTLELVDQVLLEHGPNVREPRKRTMALLMLDNVLHEEKAPHREPVQVFFRQRIGNAIDEIRQAEVLEGARIWQLYSHGFVIKTPTVTLGFDLVTVRDIRNHQLPRIDGEVRRGIEGFEIEEDLMRRLVDVVDILFVSHRHLDHADDRVAAMFFERNKPVLAPPEVWQDEPWHSRVLQLDRIAHKLQDVQLPAKNLTLNVAAYPGYQGRVQNNVYVVYTPDGLVFAHTGDQNHEDSFEWIDRVKDHHKIDVLILHCDSHVQRMARGFMPRLVIPGHINELGHPVTTRHPYWMNYRQLADSPSPWLHMAWGESYHYVRPDDSDRILPND